MEPVFGTRSRTRSPALGACSAILWISARLSKVTSGLYSFNSSSVSFALIGFA